MRILTNLVLSWAMLMPFAIMAIPSSLEHSPVVLPG